MTTWVNDGQRFWGVIERKGAYGTCRDSEQWRISQSGSHMKIYKTPQAARREARRLGKMIGYDNVAVIDYYTNDPLMVYRGR